MSKYELQYITRLARKENIFDDDIAYLEQWDFSRANINEESRIEAITKVASICYANENVVGKESLYNRLAAEAAGLPSSSFEFIPVLIPSSEMPALMADLPQDKPYLPHIFKYGEWVQEGEDYYLLTNYRALYHDNEHSANKNFIRFFNSAEECAIIKKHNKVYLTKMDIATSKQHNRHRIALQELSRRYVSGKKVEFEFYKPQELENVFARRVVEDADNQVTVLLVSNESHINNALALYDEAIERGIKPQAARRFLPQSMYTTVWSSFMPSQLENYIALRTEKHSQWEIRQIASAMKDLTPCGAC